MELSHRIFWTVSLLAGICTLASALQAEDAVGTANGDLSTYRQGPGDQRPLMQQRYDAWLNERNARYQQYRVTNPTEAGASMPAPVQVQGGGLPLGTYQVPLPIGGRPVQVVAPPQPVQPLPPVTAPGPPTVPDDVVRLTATIQGELREIGVWLERLKIVPLIAELGVVLKESEKLATMAAQRAELPALRVQLDLYEVTWLRLATRLRAAPQADPWLIGHVDAVERANDLMQELLLVGPGGVYDRVKVAALTAQLADVTGLLLRTVKVQTLAVPRGPGLVQAAQAVKGHADAMCQSVQQNLAFTLILEQYQQFSVAWTALMGQLKVPSPFEPQVRAMVQEICRIDAALNRELLVEPPVCSIHQRRVGIASSIAQLGNALVTALREQLLGNAGPVQAAEDFVQKAESLCLWLKDHPMSQVPVTRPEVVEVHAAWRRLANQLNRLERSRFPEAFKIAEQIKAERELFNQALRE